MDSQRTFRTPESHEAERETRAMLPRYLQSKGYRAVHDERNLHGKTESQTIRALTESGEELVMRVRLCWRRKRNKPNDETYSAAQLMAGIKNGDWEGSIQKKIDRQYAEGVTHLLLAQRDGKTICQAALIPLPEVLPIWCAQRDVSTELIKRGELGQRKKNHAMNGASPTLWLMDQKAPTVAAQLWHHPGVIDLGGGAHDATGHLDDTLDDLPGIDPALLGSDSARLYARERSHVARDPRVRGEVKRRARGRCERPTCEEHRDYPAFLDVHHIFGAAKSDRVYNCVAICPNCHREAHFAPDRDAINVALLAVAARYAVRSVRSR